MQHCCSVCVCVFSFSTADPQPPPPPHRQKKHPDHFISFHWKRCVFSQSVAYSIRNYLSTKNESTFPLVLYLFCFLRSISIHHGTHERSCHQAQHLMSEWMKHIDEPLNIFLAMSLTSCCGSWRKQRSHIHILPPHVGCWMWSLAPGQFTVACSRYISVSVQTVFLPRGMTQPWVSQIELVNICPVTEVSCSPAGLSEPHMSQR